MPILPILAYDVKTRYSGSLSDLLNQLDLAEWEVEYHWVQFGCVTTAEQELIRTFNYTYVDAEIGRRKLHYSMKCIIIRATNPIRNAERRYQRPRPVTRKDEFLMQPDFTCISLIYQVLLNPIAASSIDKCREVVL